jgi:predicted nucleic acid-binding protein
MGIVTVGLDTSVVLRLLTGTPDPQAQAALRWLRRARVEGALVVVSDLVVSETYFALQYHFRVPKAEALRQIAQFLASGDVTSEGVAAAVLTTPALATAKPGFVDRLIYQQYLRGGASRMATFEEAARTLPQAQVLDVTQGDAAT